MAFIGPNVISKSSLQGTDSELKGTLGWKGERGYSAYEIAVQNGYDGTEEEWLATLGTSSFFTEDKTLYTTTQANETTLDLPSIYNSSNTFIDVYIEGLRLSTRLYSINENTRKITLTNPIVNTGTEVEIVCLKMSTNNLPIVTTISSSSTNETVSSSKAVYDLIMSEIQKSTDNTQELLNTLENETTGSIMALEDDISATVNSLNNIIAAKVNKSDIRVLTGSISGIEAGATKTADISYPSGFTKDNTIIISKMSSSNSVYYDALDLTSTASGYPTVKTVALTDSVIRVWLENTNSTTARIGYYKITIMKVS